MNKKEVLKKIMEKKEFSELPIEDVEMALFLCFNKDLSEKGQIKYTR